MKNIFIIVLFFFFLGILSCGNKDDTKTDVTSKPDKKITVADNGEVISDTSSINRDTKINGAGSKIEEPKKIISDSLINKLPVDFPLDFPFYKNFDVSSSSKTDKGSKTVFEINDNIKAVSDFYKSEMPNRGFKAESGNDVVIANKGGTITFSRDGKKYDLTFRFSDSAGKTILIVNIY